MSNRLYFKCLQKNRIGAHSGVQWPLVGQWAPVQPVCLTKSGYHLARPRDVLCWLNEEIYLAEGRGEYVEGVGKVVFAEARLLKRLSWDERAARLFACDCVERVLHICEDERSSEAVRVARLFANGEASAEELASARVSAWNATRDTTRVTTRAAAWAAANDIVWGVSRAAACAASGVAERRWQVRRLMEHYLGVKLLE